MCVCVLDWCGIVPTTSSSRSVPGRQAVGHKVEVDVDTRAAAVVAASSGHSRGGGKSKESMERHTRRESERGDDSRNKVCHRPPSFSLLQVPILALATHNVLPDRYSYSY